MKATVFRVQARKRARARIPTPRTVKYNDPRITTLLIDIKTSQGLSSSLI